MTASLAIDFAPTFTRYVPTSNFGFGTRRDPLDVIKGVIKKIQIVIMEILGMQTYTTALQTFFFCRRDWRQTSEGKK